MGNTFSQKFMLVVAAGFMAAGMLYLFRHVVQQAMWESGDGWHESLKKTPAQKR
jgi:hypothetical protein